MNNVLIYLSKILVLKTHEQWYPGDFLDKTILDQYVNEILSNNDQKAEISITCKNSERVMKYKIVFDNSNNANFRKTIKEFDDEDVYPILIKVTKNDSDDPDIFNINNLFFDIVNSQLFLAFMGIRSKSENAINLVSQKGDLTLAIQFKKEIQYKILSYSNCEEVKYIKYRSKNKQIGFNYSYRMIV